MTDTVKSQTPAPTKPADPRAIFWDFVERAGWSAGQQFVAILLAAGTAGSVLALPWVLAGAMAAGAAVASLVATAVQYLTGLTGRTFWPDLAIRLVKTFLVSLAASFGAEVVNVLTFNWSEALGIAVLTTIGALGKGFLARQDGAGDNPSTLRPALYAGGTA